MFASPCPWAPAADRSRNKHPIEPPGTPEEGDHLTEDHVNKAMAFIADAKQVAPHKPFCCLHRGDAIGAGDPSRRNHASGGDITGLGGRPVAQSAASRRLFPIAHCDSGGAATAPPAAFRAVPMHRGRRDERRRVFPDRG
jgi:hypothetical protein